MMQVSAFGPSGSAVPLGKAISLEIKMDLDVPADTFQGTFPATQEPGEIAKIKVTDDSGTTLFFTLREQEGSVCLTVADNGTGIPAAIRETLFDPFVIGNQARTTGSGTGLGMAIVKRVVDLHHGTIRLVYPPQEGYKTEFEIILPRRQEQ